MCALLFAAQFTHLSAQTTVMKVWKGGNVTSSISTADVDSITFESTCDGVYLINGHKFIDLGLPSGLLWAETNIGAKTAADDGNYYAWGETDTKSTYSESTYFDSNYTTYHGKTTLKRQHDAAYINWGSSCRMPTQNEFGELLNSDNCAWTWTSMTASNGYSHNGYKVTSVKNGNSIFLPAAGWRYNENLGNLGSLGYYWTRDLDQSDSCDAYFLRFTSSAYGGGNDYRYRGRSVRPVAK